ncbi:MAG: aspartate kinase [Oscillospiraceae bacterium]|nr:aspartate kinase [Oscillospiraceae bacterium]
MYGVSKITIEEDIMLIAFTEVSCKSSVMADIFKRFAEDGVVVDMISQAAPHATTTSFSFTAAYNHFDTVMKTISGMKKQKGNIPPMISSGYTKINLFGEEMVTTCGVGAKAVAALAEKDIDIALITTSDYDISLLIRSECADEGLAALMDTFKV